ncbi:MAG TPA: YdcF family protein [Alloacidobacterium sp.]|nr:YdcF family protein [Alloacidobacterium sp.]
MKMLLRILLFAVILCLLYPAVLLGFYFFAPRQNAGLNHVDTLIVLGCPTKSDGSPTPEQRERVMEGVREYKQGVSSHIIMTGTAAHNQFVEAHAMAVLAEANGVPASAVIEENQAHDTLQNIYYSDKIMEANGWKTTEVISSPYHLPRASLILGHYPQLQWTTHPAQWPPEYGIRKKLDLDWKEARSCMRIRLHGLKPSPYLPH